MPRPARPLVAFALLALAVAPAALAQPALSPAEAQRHFRLPPGFTVELVAAEPLVRQPVTMTFDGRGRLWVIQYLQYPNPAGLTPVAVDQYLRTKYDRVPEPPPHGPRGADRVTILEDTDGDGRMDAAKDFIAGLNLASGLALGHGGAYVGQAPYLLFYPDRNRDDVPDGDPEVLLSGFGLEDAHAVLNSLQFGPDGWLYGAQGSTVTAHVRGLEFQQGIWRFHPVTHEFELFAEGGGNTWGVDFDAHGNLLAGTNWGEKILLHQVQGGYYVKGFAKHGPLHNEHAYGYFDHAPHQGHAGGHVTCGGVVYLGTAFPDEFHGCYIGANLLSNAVYWHRVIPDRSSFRTQYQGTLLATDDVWFRPVDCLVGPDGCVYVADWYDVRANHVIPEDTWDKTNGRIWRIVPPGGRRRVSARLDLAQAPAENLLFDALLPDEWLARESRLALASRADKTFLRSMKAEILRDLVSTPDAPADESLLQLLWALAASGEFDEAIGVACLPSPAAPVRMWAVRLLGDGKKVSPETLARLVELARTEPDPTVRSQLASTAKRLPAADALAIVARLIERDEDADDPFIPLLIWWAIESQLDEAPDAVLRLFASSADWQRPIPARHLIERLARRLAAVNTDAGYAALARLLAQAPDDAGVHRALAGMAQAFAGRQLAEVPPPLRPALDRLWQTAGDDPQVVQLALRMNSQPAYERALAKMSDPAEPEDRRLAYLGAVGQAGRTDAVEPLFALVVPPASDAIAQAALAALERSSADDIGRRVLALYPTLSGGVRGRALSLLCSRRAWAGELLDAVDAGQLAPEELALDRLRAILAHGDDGLAARIEQRYGRVRPATPGEAQAQIVVLARTLGEAAGDAARGKALFTKHCAICHTLFGEGAKIGPDLTSADRRNRDLLLLNVVDPSATIRPEFVAQSVVTTDGRVLTGLVVENAAETITLADSQAQKTTLPRAQIDTIEPSPVSLMPEKQLELLAPQELRDLFAYLQSNQPAK